MDALDMEAIEADRRRSPADKLREALQVMADGITLKRASLRVRYPSATDAEIEARLEAWMLDD